jgi:NIPSNAP
MSTKTYSPIVDLRMYTHQPNKRDDFIKLFEDQFIETQEAVGIQVIGQFYDLDDPNRCIWMRGFNDMVARKESLTAFYTGPVWKEYRNPTNATLIDSDNVLLLRLAHLSSGFALNGNRPPLGSSAKQDGFIAATIYYFDKPVDSDFIEYFENTIQPVLTDAGASILAYFATEDSPNTFPRLPVREGEQVFVWFVGFQNQAAYESYTAVLGKSKLWNKRISQYLTQKLKRKPEVLKLSPTPRSRLTGKP